MKKDILINSSSDEIRIAITEEGKLTEFFIESPEVSRNVGDLYYGKVAKVLHGIKAAFINIGHPQDAFLHFSDIGNSLENYYSLIDEDEDFEEDEEDSDTDDKFPAETDTSFPNIEKGREIIVQVIKEPVGKKGMRVSSKISLPGRYLVLIPFARRIGISKRIYNFREKRRLRNTVRSILPKGFGVIIRTAAAGQDNNLILDDLNNLLSEWDNIQEKIKELKPPALVYKDLSTTSSVIRDLFRDDTSRVIVDSKKLYKEIRNYVDVTSPEFSDKIELYSGHQPLFDAFNIEKQIDESLGNKVYLKNYGYLVIETTEAMTVIDVNSGNYAKDKDQEANSLKIDIEAAREIVRQLRLRDIGGIIVVDFIDLYEDANKKKLYDEMRREFRKDRAKTTVLPMTEFGLVQITRQRVRKNIMSALSSKCPMCYGTGRVQSRAFFMSQIERWLYRYKGANNSPFLTLKIHPLIKSFLKCGFISELTKLQFKYKVLIKLITDKRLPLNDFRFISRKTKKDITEEYSN